MNPAMQCMVRKSEVFGIWRLARPRSPKLMLNTLEIRVVVSKHDLFGIVFCIVVVVWGINVGIYASPRLRSCFRYD